MNKGVNDEFHRFKMPKLMLKEEGRGNGIKTVFVNMAEIANAIKRPAVYVHKYFGYELGTQPTFDVVNKRFLMDGKYETEDLEEILDDFIKIFVLCPKCENPETVLHVVSVTKSVRQTCKACGNSDFIHEDHRIITYIIKNPQDQDASSIASKQEEKMRRKSKSSTITYDSVRSKKERMDLFYAFFEERLKLNGLVEVDILAAAERLDIRIEATIILVELLLDREIMENLRKYRKVLLMFCYKNAESQKYLLGGVEILIHSYRELRSKVAQILKALYDDDIVDEETLLEWHSKPSDKFVPIRVSRKIRDKANNFMNWLIGVERDDDFNYSDGDE